MPTYVYEILDENGQPGERFEFVQSIKEPALTKHPETGQPVRRVILAPNIGGKWSEGAMHRAVSDDKKLEKLGFTKYVRAGNGVMEKRAGKGPRVISHDQPIKPQDLK